MSDRRGAIALRDPGPAPLAPTSVVHRFTTRAARVLSYTCASTLPTEPSVPPVGPVVVMLTDGPGLDPVARSAYARLPGRRQVFLASRGSGSSQPPPDAAGYRLSGHLDDLEDLHGHLGGRPVVLHGTGHGARVALAFARAHPDAVDRMVLAAGQLGQDARFHDQLLAAERRFARQVPRGRSRLRAAAAAAEDLDLAGDDATRRTALAASVQTWVARPTSSSRRFLVALTAGPVRCEAAAQAYDELVEGLDLRADLGRVSTPTLVLAGELDVTVPAEHLHEVSAALPGGCFGLVPGVGHVLELEAAVGWRRRVGAFLDA